MNLYFKKWQSPIGELFFYADDQHLVALLYSKSKSMVATEKTNLLIETTIGQLEEYFKGERKSFEIPMKPIGTEFQLKTWKQLAKIPYGKTISYKQQAERMGSAKSVRAVGTANGRNPISIIVPCHRVIGTNGTLTGYAGGLTIKEQLLKIEGAL